MHSAELKYGKLKSSPVILCSSCYFMFKMLLFCRGLHGTAEKCPPHVQTIICPRSTNQILNLSRHHLRLVVDSTGYVYHICNITVRILQRNTRLQRNTKINDKLSCNYCCRYHNNSPPFSCHFSTLQHEVNDLRIVEPIAQILLHLTLTTNHQLITAVKQNHSTGGRGYPVLWSINRNSKALIG